MYSILVLDPKSKHCKKVTFDYLNKENSEYTIENQDTSEKEIFALSSGRINGPYIKKDKDGKIIRTIRYENNKIITDE